MRPWPSRALAGIAALALLGLAGCGESTAPWGPNLQVVTQPGAATPELAVRSVEWSWNHQSVDAYRLLFTGDYRFAFSALDPYGDAYRGDAWVREDEMAFAQHLFVGGSPTEPPAISIQLSFNPKLTVEEDPRPGKDPRWHQHILTALSLTVNDPNRQTYITGFASFYLVRGDSAQVPPGTVRDSTRWYIDRWEDDTAGQPGGLAQAMPTKKATLGQLKAIYR